MNPIDILEQAVGQEYLLGQKQREKLISKLMRSDDSSKQTNVIQRNRPQPHTNKIVASNY